MYHENLKDMIKITNTGQKRIMQIGISETGWFMRPKAKYFVYEGIRQKDKQKG